MVRFRIRQTLGVGRRVDVVGGGRQGEEIAADHQHHHQERREDRASRDDQARQKHEHLGDLVDDGAGGEGENPLECRPSLFHGGDDAFQAGPREHDPRRRLGHIGRREHGDAHLSLAQRRGVVGPIAAHAHDVARPLKRLNQRELVLRKDIGEHTESLDARIVRHRLHRARWPGDAHGVGDHPRGHRGIAGHHDHTYAERVKLRDQRRRIRARRIAHGDHARYSQRFGGAGGHDQDTIALALQLLDDGGGVGRRLRDPGHRAVGALHDANGLSVRVEGRGRRHLLRGIKTG